MTLLHQAMITLPKENFIFYADTDHVPYGTKTKEQVIGFVDEVMQFMIAHDCKAVVIACNTATSVAAEIMREKYEIPIIGIEPAVKPAVEQSAGKRVMVVATPLTIQEDKLARKYYQTLGMVPIEMVVPMVKKLGKLSRIGRCRLV